MIGVIIVAEGECDGEVHKYETEKEANAFCSGVTAGANQYGAGGCSAYTREDLAILDPEDEGDAQAIEYIKQYLLV